MKKYCWVCKSINIRLKFKFGKVRLNQCGDCTFEFIDQNSTPDQHSIYTQGYFQGELSGAKGYEDYESLKLQLEKEAKKKINYIERFTKKLKLLDIGAGTGVFIKSAKKLGYKTSGNDISPYAIQHLKKEKIKTYKGSIEREIFPKNEFDIITAWDVIEHVTQPAKAIQTIKDALKPNGFLFMTTPDTRSIDARILGKYWYGYKKIPEHVGFFSKESLSKLLETSGFNVTEIKPWGFYRNLDFIVGKLEGYSNLFSPLKGFLKITRLSKVTLFFPLTDLIVVAQKNES